MARSTQVVLDASVIVKWYVKEADYEVANIIKDDLEHGMIEVIAPSLLFYEVLNALRYKPNMGEVDLEKTVKSLLDFQLAIVDLDSEYGYRIVKMAMRRGITVYDASYIALAHINSCYFFTADKKLRKKIQEEEWAKELQDYEYIRKEKWNFPTSAP
jgi:predicted nucleic acid-binding protein